jgi:hypothetical protein
MRNNGGKGAVTGGERLDYTGICFGRRWVDGIRASGKEEGEEEEKNSFFYLSQRREGAKFMFDRFSYNNSAPLRLCEMKWKKNVL